MAKDKKVRKTKRYGPTNAQRAAQSRRDKQVANKRKNVFVPATPRALTVQKSHLSDCASLYISSVEDPFNVTGACIPTQFATPSQKVSARTRGTFQTGTNGIGAIIASPRASMFSDCNTSTLANPMAAILATSATSTSIFTPLPADVGIQAFGTNSPFVSSQQTIGNINTKVVSAGLRIRNVTPALNRGGTGVGVEEPSHTDLAGNTISSMYNYATSGTVDISGGWTTVRYHPIDADEMEFLTNGGVPLGVPANNVTVVNYWGRCLGFLVSTPSGTVQTYEFEYAVNFEVVGKAAPSLTPVDADVNGLAVAANLFRDTTNRKPVLGDVASRVKPALMKALNLASELTGAFVNKQIQKYL